MNVEINVLKDELVDLFIKYEVSGLESLNFLTQMAHQNIVLLKEDGCPDADIRRVVIEASEAVKGPINGPRDLDGFAKALRDLIQGFKAKGGDGETKRKEKAA